MNPQHKILCDLLEGLVVLVYYNLESTWNVEQVLQLPKIEKKEEEKKEIPDWSLDFRYILHTEVRHSRKCIGLKIWSMAKLEQYLIKKMYWPMD